MQAPHRTHENRLLLEFGMLLGNNAVLQLQRIRENTKETSFNIVLTKHVR